jgi:hypothetical protein
MILSPDFFAHWKTSALRAEVKRRHHQEVAEGGRMTLLLARDLACIGAIFILAIVWRLK